MCFSKDPDSLHPLSKCFLRLSRVLLPLSSFPARDLRRSQELPSAPTPMQPHASQAQTQVCSPTWVLPPEDPAGLRLSWPTPAPSPSPSHPPHPHCTRFSPSSLSVSPLPGQRTPEASASQGPLPSCLFRPPAHHHKYLWINSTAFLQRSSLSLEIHKLSHVKPLLDALNTALLRCNSYTTKITHLHIQTSMYFKYTTQGCLDGSVS